MTFFKKLKERLFTLDVKNSKEEKKQLKNSIFKKENYLKNEQEKEIIKKRKKTINKYVAGLKKTGINFSRQILEIQSKYNEINEDFFEELEEILIMSDISSSLVMNIIHEIKKEIKIEKITSPKLISEIIVDKMFTIYTNNSIVDTSLNIKKNRLNVILMVGVNGSGKTTTIAKLANLFLNQNKKVLLVAADTFRAGAVEQLSIWAKRLNCEIVKATNSNDPASVVYDAIKKTKQNKYDVLIIDTAGRLQNKINLMNELKKINLIIQREIPNASYESLLVIDSNNGQNGISQALHFKEVTPVSGIVLTKMDGTSKGGIILTIKDKLNLAVKLIGLGEKIDDLEEFDLDSFIYGMMKGLIDESS